MTCKNCGEIIPIHYCTYCGQSSEVSKITWTKLVKELPETVFQINRGFLFTIKELFIRPGHAIREFVNGKRINHYKPLAYLVVLSTIYFLVSKSLGENTVFADLLIGVYEGLHEDIPALEQKFTWFADNYAYTSLLLVPIFSFSSYISFKRYDANYLEHIILNSYITGHQAIFYCLSLLSTYIHYKISIIFLFIPLFYCFWVFSQFFSQVNKLGILLRLLFSYLLYFIFNTLILFFLFGVSGI